MTRTIRVLNTKTGRVALKRIEIQGKWTADQVQCAANKAFVVRGSQESWDVQAMLDLETLLTAKRTA